jgi:hypothetical protein
LAAAAADHSLERVASGNDVRNAFELRQGKEILGAIHDGESTGSIVRRLTVGTTRITALNAGSALNHVRGRPASAIVDQVSALVETNLFGERSDIGSADGDHCECRVQFTILHQL